MEKQCTTRLSQHTRAIPWSHLSDAPQHTPAERVSGVKVRSQEDEEVPTHTEQDGLRGGVLGGCSGHYGKLLSLGSPPSAVSLLPPPSSHCPPAPTRQPGRHHCPQSAASVEGKEVGGVRQMHRIDENRLTNSSQAPCRSPIVWVG